MFSLPHTHKHTLNSRVSLLQGVRLKARDNGSLPQNSYVTHKNGQKVSWCHNEYGIMSTEHALKYGTCINECLPQNSYVTHKNEQKVSWCHKEYGIMSTEHALMYGTCINECLPQNSYVTHKNEQKVSWCHNEYGIMSTEHALKYGTCINECLRACRCRRTLRNTQVRNRH